MYADLSKLFRGFLAFLNSSHCHIKELFSVFRLALENP